MTSTRWAGLVMALLFLTLSGYLSTTRVDS